MTENRTIAAIATGCGGGIGVVRLSGKDAISITDSIFSGKKSPLDMKGYTGALGRVHDSKGELDEAVLFVYRAPHSYTGEDTCELSCHGGSFILEKVLAAAIEAGAVPAGAGEFTKRAFLNGKMTLTQAESVAQLIAGESRQAVRAALEAHDGALFHAIDRINTTLMEAAAHISAWIDYPEEDVEQVLTCDLSHTLTVAQQELASLASDYDKGRLIREGISTAIVGSPNVGKSTLMNLLTGYERSIVTDIAGTTRDVIEDRVRLGEVLLNLSDTAGIRNTDDVVEKIGVERSVSRMEQCDLILAIFDGSRPLSESDISLLERLDGRLAIGLCNKSDLPRAADMEIIAAHTCAVLEISAREGQGVAELERTVAELVGTSKLDSGAAMLANGRQLGCVVSAVKALEEALGALSYGQTLDAVSISLEEAIDSLLELTGKKASAEIIDKVFENFCVGK
ncbi:MAG: tRNA uridine-5-carboxymethylaminomethyl(34) synthesis GTPase MnmE [Angelakisella sp.]